MHNLHNLFARLMTLTALTLLIALPLRGQATQTLAVTSYFGPVTTATLYCQTNNDYATLSQDLIYLNTAQFNLSACYSTLTFATQGTTSIATVTALGYYYANGSAQGTPVLVTAVFTLSSSGQGTTSVTVANYSTKATLFASGTLKMLTANGMVLKTK